jgi:hypothetical protein
MHSIPISHICKFAVKFLLLCTLMSNDPVSNVKDALAGEASDKAFAASA